MHRPGGWLSLPALLAATLLGCWAPPALGGPSGQIDSVQTRNGVVHVLYTLRGLPANATPDVSSVQVGLNGQPQRATAELASAAGNKVTRSAVLAIDVSDSMSGARFRAARQAALTFIDQAPADVRIGLVSFAGDVSRVQAPTTNRDAVRAAVGRLRLERGTRLYQGVSQALGILAGQGSGSILVLSDGRDTSGEPLSTLLSEVQHSDTSIDVVTLGQSGAALTALRRLAGAGSGQVISADAASLSAAFSSQAAQLTSQLLISFPVPEGWKGQDATLSASVSANGVTYADDALVNIPAAAKPPTTAPPLPSKAAPETAQQPLLSVSHTVMLMGLAAMVLAGLLLALLLSNAFGGKERQSLDIRLAAYAGAFRGGTRSGPTAPAHSASVKQQAVELAEKAISRGVDVSLARRLDAAGLKVNSAEWLLLNTGAALAAAVVGFLLTNGRLIPTLLLLLIGAAVPWIYLTFKRSRRLKAFNGQLADTLQLISGSLSAGLSLAQSLDTVVREGNEPVAGEFRRVLVEQRLGVELETALAGVAERMSSDDFAWVVMAIRIQREVGGNLAELLTTVAGTLREREYLRRQVSVLSAEGRLSAYILGGLPPLFVGYLAMARPTYLSPMYTTGLGLLMSASAVVMMTVGAFWLKKSVKVEV